jgi:hypothetical protein
MNHLVVLVNIFGAFPSTRILMYRIESKHHEIIATFLDEINALGPQLREMVTIDENVKEIIRTEMI